VKRAIARETYKTKKGGGWGSFSEIGIGTLQSCRKKEKATQVQQQLEKQGSSKPIGGPSTTSGKNSKEKKYFIPYKGTVPFNLRNHRTGEKKKRKDSVAWFGEQGPDTDESKIRYTGG